MMLSIKNLKAEVEGRRLSRDSTCRSVPARCTRSWGRTAPANTLAHILAGRDGYDVTDGEILFEVRV